MAIHYHLLNFQSCIFIAIHFQVIFICIFSVLTIIRQSGHRRRVAQAHYAIDGAFLHRLGLELIMAFEQASIAWHKLWELQSIGKSIKSVTAKRHQREASQQLTSRPAKRERVESIGDDSMDKALVGLQCIY